MIKLNTSSDCSYEGEAMLVCPKCGKRGTAHIFSTETGLCLNSIQIKQIHNSFFAVCAECRSTFEVDEWK